LTERSLLIQRPRIVSTRRVDSNTFSVGDEATVEVGPGLLQFLQATDPTGRSLSEGFAVEWALPLGAAASAAIAVTDPPALRGLNYFTGVTLEISWHRAWKPTESLIATCHIESLGKSSARLPFRVVSGEDGGLIVEGHYVYVNITGEGSRPFERTRFPDAAQTVAAPREPEPPPSPSPEPELLRRLYWTYRDWRDAGRRPAPGLWRRLYWTYHDSRSPRSFKSRFADAVLPKETADRLRRWYWRRLQHGESVPPSAPPPPVASPPSVEKSNGPVAAESEPAAETINLLRLRSPVLVSSSKSSEAASAGDVWMWNYPNDLFRLLMTPMSGAAHPLARRAHPLSNIQLAISVHAANAITPAIPVKASVQWMKTLEGRSDFQLRSEVASVDESVLVTDNLISEEGTPKTKVNLVLQRVHAGHKMAAETVSPLTTPGEAIELIDLHPKIARLNPDYFRDEVTGGLYQSRLQNVHFATSDGLLYLLYANAFVFTSSDGCRTLQEVREINYRGDQLVTAASQSVDAVVDTMRRTVLLLGTDERDGRRRGVAWRKESGQAEFTRSAVTDEPWLISKAGNASAGFFGRQSMDMVAVSMYVPGAHFYFSVDDGHSWRKQDLSDVFAEHVHEVYLPRSTTPGRPARLWVTGGDDPSGERSGVICYDTWSNQGGLGEFRFVLRERSGYRLVAISGNGKHVYIGNESVAGGVLKILDNQEALDASDFEYVLGKNRHDYHQFRSLLATLDGFLVSATDSYNFVGDSVRADSGGYIYISNDDGASFREIPLAAKWVTGLTCDGRSFWATVSTYRENGVDTSENRFTVLRIPKPSSVTPLMDPYCVKAVVVDSSAFYEMARYKDHPRASLDPGERTFRVDLSKYRTISVTIDAWGPASLVVEALPFYNWSLAENRWIDVERIVVERAGIQQVMLSDAASHNRFFRIRNDGKKPAEFRSIAFVGKV